MDQRSKNKLKRKMRKIKKMNFNRRIIQLVCFFLLPGLFIQIYTSTKALVMALVNSNFSLQANLLDLVVVLSVYPLTLLLGRFFCGWVCAMGSIGDLLTAIRNGLKIKELKMEGSADQKLKAVKYILLLFAIIFIWVLQIVAIPQGLNPLDAFGVLVSLNNWDLLLSTFLIATILLAAVLVISFFVPRFFCRYLCPTGALLSLLSLPRMLTIKKPRENCRNCTLCTQNCPMAIPLYKTDKSRSGECIECGQCVIGCPMDNCHMQLAGKDLNAKTIGTIAATTIVGLNYLGTISANAVAFESAQTLTMDASQSAAASSAKYQDGSYPGTATGFQGQITVDVTVANGLITAIDEVSNEDTPEFFNRCWNVVTGEIIQSQTTDVDAVSGATYSSQGIMEAVAAALSGQAGTTSATSESAESILAESKTIDSSSTASSQESSLSSDAASLYTDGTYEGSGTGLRGETLVEVTVQGGQITAISEISKQDDDQFFYRAWDTVTEEIIAAQSIEVDAVSGATYSSNSIMEAVAAALDLNFENPNSTLQGGHGRP